MFGQSQDMYAGPREAKLDMIFDQGDTATFHHGRFI